MLCKQIIEINDKQKTEHRTKDADACLKHPNILSLVLSTMRENINTLKVIPHARCM